MEPNRILEFTMVMENLRETCEEIARLETEYKDRLDALYRERNRMLDSAVEVGIPIRRLQAVSNLSRERIYQVRKASRPNE